MRPVRKSDSSPPPLQEFADTDVMDITGQVNRGVFDEAAVGSGGTVETDFGDGTLQTIVLDGDVGDWVTTGRPDATGTPETRECRVLVDPDGVERDLAFSVSWKWYSGAPMTIGASDYGVLTLIAVGSSESDVWAKWEGT